MNVATTRRSGMKWFKRCIRCGIEQDSNLFHKDSSKKDGKRPYCKVCDLAGRDKTKRSAYEKEYWSTRKTQKAEIVKKSMSRNKEHHVAVRQTYRSTEHFKILHANNSAKRRARMQSAYVEFVDYREVYAESNGMCFYCGKTLAFHEAEFDHYIPIVKGGPHKKDNIKCSCQYCNRSKGAKLPEAVAYQMV
jgi:5-methylcytosine-specific restriction endonuclease McrA